MLAIPRRVKGITHPLINEVYVKKHNDENVLVIEAQGHTIQGQVNSEGENPYITDLLSDLDHVESQVRRRGAEFDRVDIRTSTINTNEMPMSVMAAE